MSARIRMHWRGRGAYLVAAGVVVIVLLSFVRGIWELFRIGF